MAVYKQFNTNEVVVSPFNSNKRFRFENNQVTSSDVQIEYYQSQQGTYLSGSFDTGFNTMQDGVTVFSSIKQLYYSNYLTASTGDPMPTQSLIPGRIGPTGNSLGFDQYVGNTTGPRFDNFLQSSLTQDRKFSQFSASVAPIGFAGTNTEVSQSINVSYNATPNDINITFNAGQPDLSSVGINETYILSTATWNGALNLSPFLTTSDSIKGGALLGPNNNNLTVASGTTTATVNNQSLDQFANSGTGIGGSVNITINTSAVAGGSLVLLTGVNGGIGYKIGDIITITAADLNPIFSGTTFTPGTSTTFTIDITDLATTQVQTINASDLIEERINPDVFITPGTPLGRGLTSKGIFVLFQNAGGAGSIALNYIQAPRGPSVISIPSMLFGEAVQPSSFQFEYTSSINFTRSIVDDDGQGNLIVTQSNSTGVPFFSGSVGQIFYSQGIAVITGPDSGSLREFAHNVGYKGNMNPNIVSSSISYSSSITIDENQYKCTVRDSEFGSTTNPSALRPPGELTQTNNQLFKSFDNGNIVPVAGTYKIFPRSIFGDVKATTYYIFGDRASTSTIGQQYVIELISAQGKSLEFVGFEGNINGRKNSLNQVEFNSTGSAVGIARGFAIAINSEGGFNGEISASLQSTVAGLDTVMLTQIQAGTVGNTRIRYTDSFNLLLQENAYAPIPARGQVKFGNTNQPSGNPQPVNGTDLYLVGEDGAILNVIVNSTPAVTNIDVSSSFGIRNISVAEAFTGTNYKVGDKLEILGSDLGGSGTGYINLTRNDVEDETNSTVYHDFITGSEFSPYVTTVGLYNASNELVVVGKFPRPLPISLQTDTTYMINFDTN